MRWVDSWVEKGIFKEKPEIKEEEKRKVLDVPVIELDLSKRSYNCLRRGYVDTVLQLVDLLKKDEDGLKQIRGMGTPSITEIKDKLAKFVG
jgi:DNA-directed RNA polymerase alpha subunit